MKKLFSLCLLALMCMGVAKAEVIELGPATSSSTHLPTPTLWKYSITQQIYTDDEIRKGGMIESISFCTESNFQRTRTLDIYLAVTSQSTFHSKTSWVDVSNSDKKFSGMVTFNANDWTTITLDRPFDYNGYSNLIVVVDDHTGSFVTVGSSTASPLAFKSFEGEKDRTIYAYTDNSAYDPQNLTSNTTATGVESTRNCIRLGFSDEVVQIGAGSKGVKALNDLPFCTSSPYSLSQQIFTKDELGEAGIINSLSFYLGFFGNPLAYYDRLVKIYIQNCGNKDCFDRYSDRYFTQQQTDDLVYSGDLSFGDQDGYDWVTITFDKPFEYSGDENILLTVEDTTGTANRVYYHFAYLAPDKAISARSDIVHNITSDEQIKVDRISDYRSLIRFNKEEKQLQTIDRVEINNHVEACVGQHPDYNLTLPNGAPYSIKENYWMEMADVESGWQKMEADETFNSDYLYYNYISLKANPGYKFADDVAVLINGSDDMLETSPSIDTNVLTLMMRVKKAEDASSTSDELQIGSGDLAINMPTETYYKYTVSQQIYTAAEIGRAGYIKSIAFHNTSSTTTFTRNLDIYLAHTSKGMFSDATDWQSVTSSDKVYSGNVTFTTAELWTWITFDTPFYYDGTQNLILCVDDNTGSWQQERMECSAFQTPGSLAQTLYAASDNTDFDALSLPGTLSGSAFDQKNQLRLEIKDDAGPTPIKHVEISGFTAPRLGQHPDLELSVPDDAPYFIAGTYWARDVEQEGAVVHADDVFDSETMGYFQMITIQPKDGYEFRYPVTAVINGDASIVEFVIHWSETMIGVETRVFYATRPVTSDLIDFETGDFSQADFTDTSEYPWIVTRGEAASGTYCMKNGNTGISSSSSAIETSYTYEADGFVYFDAKCMGEGAGSGWDKCQFFIDGEEQMSYGARGNVWLPYFFPVTAGSHTFRWAYTKDSSIDATGDAFYVDNIRFLQEGRDDDFITGISLTPSFSEGEGAVYNLAGQRIGRLPQQEKAGGAVYIIDRKKVLIK